MMEPVLQFNVRNQNISRVDNFHVVANSKNYVRALFYFLTDDWNDVTKTAIFDAGEKAYEMLLNEENTCMIPWEWLKEPGIKHVSVFGGNLITVNKETVTVHESGYKDGETPREPTPDIYQQILTLLRNNGDGLEDSRQYGWMEEPVLEIELTEDVTSIYINDISGHPFEFSELACTFRLEGITVASEGRLSFAPKIIDVSYHGIIVANTNGEAGYAQKGVFHIRKDPLYGWHSVYASAPNKNWLSGNNTAGKHIPILNRDAAAGIFADVERGINQFCILPYSGLLHAGSIFKIYGRPVKTEATE